tara:strand:+ start:56449 stop:59472 length:3024 start_codon:yes stop_codon:yes gene_type:complete
MVLSNVTYAQQRNVKGTVTTGDDPLGLPGVNILLKGTTVGTVTDLDGNYSINVTDGSSTLVFSMIGFENQEAEVGSRSIIDIILSEDISALDEVVVVGYGTVKKSDLTGSVGVLKKEDFNAGVITSAEQLLAGKIPGVQVVQNSAEPGGAISVNIRGVGSVNSGTSPLYVIDGLPMDNSLAVSGSGSNFDQKTSRNPLSSLNPGDIESIEVLKDASSTAIYGARGANGVILITTKKGSTGALKTNYDFYLGVQNVAKKLDVLNPTEYQSILNSIIEDGGGSESERVNDLQGAGTNWQDQVYQDNALVQSHNLSFTGGNDKTQFYAGLNYFDQDGVVKNSSYERFGFRLNLEHKVTDKFVLGTALNSTYTKDTYFPSGFSINEGAGVLYSAYNYDPTISPYNADGSYNRSSFMTMDSPLALINGKTSSSNGYRTFGTFYMQYFLTKELSFRVNLGGDINSQQRDTFVDRSTIDGSANGGIASVLTGSRSNYLFEGLLNYNKVVGEHSISSVFGATTQRFVSTNFNGTARGFPSDVLKTNNLSLGDPLLYTLSNSRSSNQLLSYLGRVNYIYKNKYLLTASIRADGSSRFGANNRFGYFPSIAAGWKINEEAFFSGIEETVSTLKLRTSWGRTGNQEIGNYQAITTFGNGPIAVMDDKQVKTLDPTRIGNEDLVWETTEQFNVGIDYGFFQDRLQGSIDYYKKNTFNMLLNLPIPTETGFTTQTRNVGSVQNSGFEFGLTSTNINSNSFKWTTNLLFNAIENEVTDLGGIPRIVTGSAGFSNQISVIEEGLPLNSFYGYEILGIWQEVDDFDLTNDNVAPGDFKYRDVDGNGVVNSDDRVILGNSFPKFIWSIGNTLTYKGFELYAFFEGQEGLQMYNGNLAETYFPISFRRNKLAEPMQNRWTAENPSNVYPSFINPLGQGQKSVNSYTVEDASYVRLNTVRLSYNLNVKSKLINSAKVYVTGQNLATWTSYSGLDPAVNPNGGANLRIDFNAYPIARTFMGGVILQF